MNDLDTLLTSALIDSLERDEVDSAKQRLRRLRTSPFPQRHEEEQEALRALINRFEEKHEWYSVAQVVLIHRQTCDSCNHIAEWGDGLFLRQSHIRLAVKRLIPNNWPNCALSREIEFHDSVTPFCAHCARTWATETGESL